MMFTRIKLENFKSWQSLDIEMAPLTLLFGTNSSGKSSILQAILLILQSVEKHHLDELNFGGGRGDYVNLGGYSEVVHNHDVDLDISIEIEVNITVFGHKSVGLEMCYEDDEVVYETIGSYDTWDYFVNTLQVESANCLIHYVAPLRQYPTRAYLWSGARPYRIEPDGENTIVALIADERIGGTLTKQVSHWLAKMELVDNFSIKPLDTAKRFYETEIKIQETLSSLIDTGFGVSQVLPIITTLFFVPEGSIVLLEQPELHLHPRAQAHLADLMLHVAEERKLQLIVESHSEHLLRRLQRRIAEPEHEFANPDNIKMYFCDMGENGSTIQDVEVDEYGQIQNWPDKFFGDITGDLEAMTMAALKRVMNGKN
jgi:predicted ATPase